MAEFDSQFVYERNERKTIVLKPLDPSVETLTLFPDEGISLSYKNNFEFPLKDIGKKIFDTLGSVADKAGAALPDISKAFNVLNAVASGARGAAAINLATVESALRGLTGNKITNIAGKSWYENLPAWSGTDPLEVSFSFSFFLGMGMTNTVYGAKSEVFDPICKLVDLALPYNVSGSVIQAPYPVSSGVVGTALNILLKKPADAFQTLWGNIDAGKELSAEDTKSISENMSSLVSGKSKMVDIFVGGATKPYFKLRKCFISNVQWSFSSDTDEDGYPIAGKANVSFMTYDPPSSSVLVGLNYGEVLSSK